MPAKNHILTIRQAAAKARLGTASDIDNYVLLVVKSYLGQSAAGPIIASRIAELQKRHLAGQISGSTEGQVVKALNKLAVLAQLPEHAKTSELEFRLLRIQMLQAIPELNPSALASTETFRDNHGQTRQRISHALEPVEMLYLVESLVYQKLLNPNYQLTADELQQKYFQQHAQPHIFDPTQATVKILDSNQGDPASSARLDQTRQALFGFVSAHATLTEWSSAVDEFLGDIGYAQ